MNIDTNTNTNYKYNLWSQLKLPSVNISIYNPIFIGVQEVWKVSGHQDFSMRTQD